MFVVIKETVTIFLEIWLESRFLRIYRVQIVVCVYRGDKMLL